MHDRAISEGRLSRGSRFPNGVSKRIIIMAASLVLLFVVVIPLTAKLLKGWLSTGELALSQYPDPAEIAADDSLGEILGRVDGDDPVAMSLDVAAMGVKMPRTLIVMPVLSEGLAQAFPVVVLAGQEKAPILVTPYDSLDQRIYDKIVEVRPEKIFIAGGLDEDVVTAIKKINRRTTVEVLQGKDQWATVAEINSRLTDIKGAFVFGSDVMKLAAIVAPVAASHSYAIYLAKEDGSLPQGVVLPDENVYLIDGKQTVQDIPGAQRLEGYNVFALNRSVLEAFSFDFSHALVINSQDDSCISMMAAPCAALRNSPIILSGADGTFSGVSARKKDEILSASCTLIGNTSKLRDDVQQGFVLSMDIQNVMIQWQVLQPRYMNVSDHVSSPYSLTPPYGLGALTPGFVTDGINMVNFVRYLAGVPSDVTVDAEYAQLCQSAAILLRYEFSHTPKRPDEMDVSFYERALAGTSHSNIAKGFSNLADSVRNGYMRDSDTPANLALVGHRRWILNPKMQKTGFGFVLDSKDSSTYTALYSQDQSRADAPSLEYVAWPGGRVFPQQFLQAQDPWSVSLNTDRYMAPKLNEVKVTLTEVAANKSWLFSAQDNEYSKTGKYFNVDTQKIGDPACIVFRPDGVTNYRGKYHVSITGLRDRRGQSASIEYDVTFFDMNEYERVTSLYDPAK